MVADRWFRQVEKVLEAMKITFDATRIRLAAFSSRVNPRYGGIGSKPRGIGK